MKRNRVIICVLIFCIVTLSAVIAKAQGDQLTTQIPLASAIQGLFNLSDPWTNGNPLIGSFGSFNPWTAINPLIGGFPRPWPMINSLIGGFGFPGLWPPISPLAGGFDLMNPWPMINSSANYSSSAIPLLPPINSLAGTDMEIVIKSDNRCILGPIDAEYTNMREIMFSGIVGTIIPNTKFMFYEKPFILVMPDFTSTPIPVPYYGD